MTTAFIIIAAVVGIALGYLLNRYLINAKSAKAADEAQSLLNNAKQQAETLKKEQLLEAKDQIYKQKQEAEEESRTRRKEISALENRLVQREETIERRAEAIDKREHQISSAQGQISKREQELDELFEEEKGRLERVAGMTVDEAKHELIARIEDDVKRDAATLIRDTEQKAKDESDKRARNIVSLAIQRVAADHTAESTVSVVHIPSDEMKGRLIGREGRNIRAFEQITGINLIIDDTP